MSDMHVYFIEQPRNDATQKLIIVLRPICDKVDIIIVNEDKGMWHGTEMTLVDIGEFVRLVTRVLRDYADDVVKMKIEQTKDVAKNAEYAQIANKIHRLTRELENLIEKLEV